MTVLQIFHEEQTQNDNLEEASNEDDFKNHYETEHISDPYVPAALVLTDDYKEHSAMILQLLEVQYLDQKFRQAAKIDEKPLWPFIGTGMLFFYVGPY